MALKSERIEEYLVEVNYALFWVFNYHISPVEGYFTDKKTKAQAKLV